ncbi:hypothetical protein [Mesorhizobium sp. NFR06]|uniref:hypothetical protein n=1 Tax=Mesorhizobium sp. NFR06 TaxID=1566290 RepID=UPI00122D6363|nr:hypothetical protein [Mesorhizobium sp. NFR06]
MANIAGPKLGGFFSKTADLALHFGSWQSCEMSFALSQLAAFAGATAGLDDGFWSRTSGRCCAIPWKERMRADPAFLRNPRARFLNFGPESLVYSTFLLTHAASRDP